MPRSQGVFPDGAILDTAGSSGRYLVSSITEPEETAVDIAGWLRDLGLDRYEAAFRENDVNADILLKLTGDDLKDLGVTSVGHRRQILDAIATCALKAGRLMVPFSYQPGLQGTSCRRRPLVNAAS